MKLLKSITASFLSRKLLATIAAAWLLVWFHDGAVSDLKGMESEKAASLTTIFITTSGTLGALLIGYLGFQTLQTRFGLSGVAQVMASRDDGKTEHTEKREDVQRIIHESAEKFRDDPSYCPIQPDTEETFR
jgi:hypothetical protein